MIYRQAINEALHASFEADPAVCLLGEDLADPYGGAFKVSKGLSSRFPNRVFSTPISEAAIVGVCSGLAMRGMKPVVEIMFGDFLTLCADQIVNHATKFRAMYDGQVSVPLVIRMPVGGGRGYGPTHSQALEKLFLGVPHLTVLAPSHVHDPGSLLQQVILRGNGVVLFIEHKLLYPMTLLTADSDSPLRLELIEEAEAYPTALLRNFRRGEPDVTFIGYGGMSRLCVKVMQDLADEEIRILAVFPASLKPVPIDTLCKAAAASRRVVVGEEGCAGFNWGSEIAALLSERLWGKLDRPVLRIASEDAVIPAARELEDQVLITSPDIEAAIMEVLQ